MTRQEDENEDGEESPSDATMRAVAMLAGGVAHDVNNALTAILGHAELVAEQYPDTRQAVQPILEATQLATGITRRLSAFGSGSVRPSEAVDVDRAVQARLATMRGLHPSVTFHESLEGTGWCVLQQPGQLEQVLANLLSNAIEAVEESGDVHVSTRIERSELVPTIAVVIGDDGPGMDEDVRDRVFDPYFTTKTSAGGRGLGMTVVGGILRQLGGSVEIRSETGKGCEVSIRLPAREVNESSLADIPFEEIRGNEHILLVDDNAEIVRILSRGLSSLGYQVEACFGGLEAQAILKSSERSFDAIVTDLRMDGADGFAVAACARKQIPNIPVVFLSGHLPRSAHRSTARLARARTLGKPVGIAGLAQTLRSVLGEE